MRTFTFLLALALLACGDDDSPGDAALDSEDATPEDATSEDATSEDATSDASEDATDASMSSCSLPEPFDRTATFDRTLYVAVGGTGDGSEGAPFGRLGDALGEATAGTRIVVRAGTYTGSFYAADLVGPIAVVAEDEVILDGGGGGEVLHVSSAHDVLFEGFTIRNATDNGVNIDDGGTITAPSTGVVLADLTLRDIGSGGNNDCIKLSGVDDLAVVDSDFAGCNAGDAIDMVGCHHVVISGNHFHDTVGSGAIQAKGGSADVLVHGNRFIDVRGRGVNAGGSTGLEFFRPADAPYEAARIVVAANVFVRSGEDSGAPIAFVGCDACAFVNNTVIEPATWVARILQETTGERFVPSRNGLYVNNLVVLRVDDLRSGVFVNVGEGTAPETFTFGSNLWLALDRDASWPGPTLGDGIPAESGSLVQEDPALVDRDGGDVHLSEGSAAVGAGRSLEDLSPFPDLDGRCFADPPSLGALEADTD